MGGGAIDQGNGIAVDNVGNVSVVGQYYSSSIDADPGPGVFTLNNAGNADIFLINLDVNGNFVWAKSIGASGADYANKVAVDKSGAKIIGGQFQGSISIGNKTLTSSAEFSALVAKYNAVGNELWAFNLGQSGTNLITGASVDSKDGIVVAGRFSGTVNFNPLGAAYNLTAINGGGFVARYTPAGQLSWVKPIYGTVTACNLSVDANDNAYVISPYTSQLTFDGGITLPLTGTQDVSIAKYASDGTFVWANGIGGGSSEITNYEVAASNDNNIYVSGFFRGAIDFDPSVGVAVIKDHGVEDLFLARYDSDGNYKWAINSGNNSCSDNVGRTVAVDGNNDVILGGAFCSTVNFDVSGCSSYNVTAQSGTRDGFLAKYVPAATGLANGDITAPSIVNFCGSGQPGVIVGASPTGGAGVYSYKWQSSPDGVSFTDINTGGAKDFAPPVLISTFFTGALLLPVIVTSPW